MLEPAAWAENIPFNETRDYVKKVLSNASFYAALISGEAPSLKARLGRFIGPRAAACSSSASGCAAKACASGTTRCAA